MVVISKIERKYLPFGDGKAGERVVGCLDRWGCN